MGASDDATVESYRRRISETDLTILAAVNRRITLVAELHAHKREQGYPLTDPGREQAMLEQLTDANPGPLTDEGAAQLLATLLQVSSRREIPEEVDA